MPAVIPFVPQNITVHLGTPTSDAANVTVSFADYVKNVASSEIYPTWEESALRANILAITSYALNRIYTEYYRSRGYDFDITNSTAFDQAEVSLKTFPGWWMTCSMIICADRNLWSRWLQNSATVPPSPVKA